MDRYPNATRAQAPILRLPSELFLDIATLVMEPDRSIESAVSYCCLEDYVERLYKQFTQGLDVPNKLSALRDAPLVYPKAFSSDVFVVVWQPRITCLDGPSKWKACIFGVTAQSSLAPGEVPFSSSTDSPADDRLLSRAMKGNEEMAQTPEASRLQDTLAGE